MKKTVSIIAILGLAAYLGNIINVGLTYAIAWQQMDPMEFMEGFGKTFMLLLPTVAVTLLPGFVATIWMMSTTKELPEARKLWKWSLLATSLSLGITLVYHLPTNLGFMDLAYTAEELTGRLNLWVILHWVRIGLALVASIYAASAMNKSFTKHDV